jgi:hypothetical protein
VTGGRRMHTHLVSQSSKTENVQKHIRMYRAIQNARPELLQFWSCAESLSSFTDRLQK